MTDLQKVVELSGSTTTTDQSREVEVEVVVVEDSSTPGRD